MSAHQVVEASAGTGKTYWIEHEVLRLIDNGVPLSRMLLVTFTEKATAELQERIRKRIAKCLSDTASDPTRHSRFVEAERELDTASIFTIHGFCNQTLGDFAFEMQEHLSASLVNDGELRKTLLAGLIREWPARYGAILPDLLFLSGFPNVNRGDNSSMWENNVLSLASKMGPRDRILPANPIAPTAENIQKISSLMESCAAQLGEMQPDPRDEPLIKQFSARTKASSRSKEVKFLAAFVTEVKSAGDDSMFRRSVRFCYSVLREGLDVTVPGEGKLEAWTRQLQQVCDLLRSMQHYLTVVTLSELEEKVRRHKLSKNLRSYNDMLTQLHDAVMQHESLRQKLREKYIVAIVDEFQDTDSIQWEIFQKLFLESRDNSLIIVGDPKQAIYGFRGANVRIYQAAASRMLSMSPPAALTELKKSFRSSRPLMTALNRLFAAPEWFGDAYQDVEATDKALQSAEPEPALNFLDLREASRAPLARRTFSEFAASEIIRLLKASIQIPDEESGALRPLQFSDFAVLVKAKTEARSLERAFRAAGIPHGFYKKLGIFESREAMEWALILKATSTLDFNSIRKALLTRFFSMPLSDLLTIDEVPSPVLDQFRRWNTLAQERRWSRMFAEMMNDTAILLPGNVDAIVEGKESVDPTDDFERRRANLEQIAQDLEITARQERMDLNQMIDALQDMRLAPPTQDESTLHSEESDADRVRIMTIHASKGLEFPVVFITGGFYEQNFATFAEYFESESSQDKVFDLDTRKKSLMAPQTAEDQKRLYYVAFTRAQFKAYAPLFPSVKKDGEMASTAGPVSTLIFRAAARLPAELMNIVPAKFEPGNAVTPLPTKTQGEAVTIIPYPEISRRARGLTSYSGILRIGRSLESHSVTFGKGQKMDEVESIASDTEPETKRQENILPIPGGRRTGDALHAILENLDFSTFSLEKPPALASLSESTRNLIQTSLARNGIDADLHAESVVRLVWNTLNTELPQVGKLSSLTSLSPEMEFMLAVPEQHGEANWEQIVLRKGFVYGAMDLVFCHEKKYYLLDWKTNTLPSYDAETLKKSIKESRYDLQYEIYAHALISWLSSMPGFSPDWFGGVFYLYLRGMEPGTTNGIFELRPEPASLSNLGDIVRRAFRGNS